MIETQPGFSFRHSAECISMLHGESLAGCLKVRWTDGNRIWYDGCCIGELVPITEEGKIDMTRMPTSPPVGAIKPPPPPAPPDKKWPTLNLSFTQSRHIQTESTPDDNKNLLLSWEVGSTTQYHWRYEILNNPNGPYLREVWLGQGRPVFPAVDAMVSMILDKQREVEQLQLRVEEMESNLNNRHI